MMMVRHYSFLLGEGIKKQLSVGVLKAVSYSVSNGLQLVVTNLLNDANI